MPKAYITEDGFRLGAWVGRQRGMLKTIDKGRKEKLDELGFIWLASK